MKKGKTLYLAAILVCCFCVLSACGKNENVVVTQMGVDGYVYVAQEISWTGQAVGADEEGPEQESQKGFLAGKDLSFDTGGFRNLSGLKIYGDYLYFFQNGDVRRIPKAGDLDFSKAETVVQGVSALRCYEMDSHEGICYYEGNYEGSEKGSLSRKTADGTLLFRIEIAGGMGDVRSESCLALDGEDRIYLLLEDGIHVIDREGKTIDLIPTEVCKANHSYIEEILMSDGTGNIYYILGNITQSYVYSVEQGESEPLTQIRGLQEERSIAETFRDCLGGLLISDTDNQLLYRYEKDGGGKELLLRWQDSGLNALNLDFIAELSPDRLLAIDGENAYAPRMYVLTRTNVDELPQKELIVLASLYPTDDMMDFILEFNKSSDRYHVVIERYGAKGDAWSNFFEVDEDCVTRLDVTLASGERPDLLDLSLLDAGKYAYRGVLEDLFPYLEGSSRIKREDFLENVIEGYTMDGKLAAIPVNFRMDMLLGRASQLSGLESWTTEDMMTLLDQYPGCDLLMKGTLGDEREFLIREVCAPYYLKKFIDEETVTCSFDSEEFCKLLTWLKDCPVNMEEHDYNHPLPENCLLFYNIYSSLGPDYRMMGEPLDNVMGAEAALIGYPSADGIGRPRIKAFDVLGIVSGAECPEGAWVFIETYLTRKKYDPYMFLDTSFLSPLWEENEKMKELALAPLWKRDYNGIPYEIYDYPEERVRKELMETLEHSMEVADFRPWTYENDVMEIILEEAESYFKGEKTVEEAAAIIQNRVSILLSDRLG